jgi:hypothetical protein
VWCLSKWFLLNEKKLGNFANAYGVLVYFFKAKMTNGDSQVHLSGIYTYSLIVSSLLNKFRMVKGMKNSFPILFLS